MCGLLKNCNSVISISVDREKYKTAALLFLGLITTENSVAPIGRISSILLRAEPHTKNARMVAL